MEIKRETCVLDVKVLAHCLIQKFSGEAIVAAAHPRFVVTVLIANTKSPYIVPGTQVTLATYRVAFFAIGSITKVFAESDIIGKEYRLMVSQEELAGRRTYSIGLAGGEHLTIPH